MANLTNRISNESEKFQGLQSKGKVTESNITYKDVVVYKELFGDDAAITNGSRGDDQNLSKRPGDALS